MPEDSIIAGADDERVGSRVNNPLATIVIASVSGSRVRVGWV